MHMVQILVIKDDLDHPNQEFQKRVADLKKVFDNLFIVGHPPLPQMLIIKKWWAEPDL